MKRSLLFFRYQSNKFYIKPKKTDEVCAICKGVKPDIWSFVLHDSFKDIECYYCGRRFSKRVPKGWFSELIIILSSAFFAMLFAFLLQTTPDVASNIAVGLLVGITAYRIETVLHRIAVYKSIA